MAKGGGHGAEGYTALKDCTQIYIKASKDKFNSSQLDKSNMSTFHKDIDKPLARAANPKAASAPTKDAKGNEILLRENGKPLLCPRCKGHHYARGCTLLTAVKCAYCKEAGHEDKGLKWKMDLPGTSWRDKGED